MPSRRTSRVNEQIREEISDLIRNQLRDPRIGEIVSITEVEIAPDFSTARVYVSTYGDDTAKRQTIEALSAASGFIRRELKPRLTMRNIPVLTFVRDDSLETGQHLTDLIRGDVPVAEPPHVAPAPPRRKQAGRTKP